MWCQFIIEYDYRNWKLLDSYQAGNLARKILKTIHPFCKRKFYLYELSCEPSHMLIAFELKSPKFIEAIRMYIKFLEWWVKGDKVLGIKLRENTNEKSNGELFLNILDTWCNQLVYKFDDFMIQQPGRKKGLKRLHHILHCLMNPLFGSRNLEIKCYKQMSNWYKIPGSTLIKKL